MCTKHYTDANALVIIPTTLHYYYSHILDEETYSKPSSELPEITELVIKIQVSNPGLDDFCFQ